MKRFFDIVASFLGLLVLSPLFLFLSIWIKINSRGPVFYKQVRVGLHGKDFVILKFRSMRVGSDKKGLITVGGYDPRVTSSGYYIRKFKLDEFPQLLNVLFGDMSLVGPRPEVRKYVEMYSADQLNVLNVRPGITDMASVIYSNENELLESAKDPEKYYMEVIMPDKLRINLYYMENNSLFSDIKLIFKTLRKIINTK